MPEIFAPKVAPATTATNETTPATSNPQASSATAPEVTASPEKVSAKFAALARKEKQALVKLEAAKTREQALIAREQALQAREAKLQEFENIKSTNPLRALEMTGVSYQDLTQTVLNNGELTPEMQINNLRKEVETFKEQQERLAKEQAEAAAKRASQDEQEILATFKSEIDTFIKGQGSKFELIQSFNQTGLVYDTIDAQFQRTGRILSISEASEMVEKYLESEIEKALEIPKFRAKATPPPPPVEARKPVTSPWGPKPVTRTLTNSATNAATSSKPASLTDRERLERARARLRGQQT
jgi:cell division septation protein DedD